MLLECTMDHMFKDVGREDKSQVLIVISSDRTCGSDCSCGSM